MAGKVAVCLSVCLSVLSCPVLSVCVCVCVLVCVRAMRLMNHISRTRDLQSSVTQFVSNSFYFCFVLFVPGTGLDKIGTYTMRFPVIIPSRMPAYNIWAIALCQHFYLQELTNGTTLTLPSNCYNMTGPDVVAVIPEAGFQNGEIHPQFRSDGHGSGTVGLQLSAMYICILFVALQCFSDWD